MAKWTCPCGNTMHSSGDMPNPQQWLLFSDRQFDKWSGMIAADDIYRAATPAYRCEVCDRLHVLWNGYDEPHRIYAPHPEGSAPSPLCRYCIVSTDGHQAPIDVRVRTWIDTVGIAVLSTCLMVGVLSASWRSRPTSAVHLLLDATLGLGITGFVLWVFPPLRIVLTQGVLASTTPRSVVTFAVEDIRQVHSADKVPEIVVRGPGRRVITIWAVGRRTEALRFALGEHLTALNMQPTGLAPRQTCRRLGMAKLPRRSFWDFL